MKKKDLIICIVSPIAILIFSCGGNVTNDTSSTNKSSISNEITIGKQVWMTRNLNVDKFRNGDSIPNSKTKEEWIIAGEKKQPAWCYYDNHEIQDDPKNGDMYGKLYNWYAVNDSRGLAPLGWHIPSDDEWTMLTNQLGGRILAHEKLKSANSWSENRHGTDSVGFNALPGGFRLANGEFWHIGDQGGWWSSSNDNPTGKGLYLHEHGKPLFGGIPKDASRIGSFKTLGGGMSVRCVKD